MIVLTFALPDESRAFAASLTGHSHPSGGGALPLITAQWNGHDITIVHTGVGDTVSSRNRLESMIVLQKPRLLISSGYAGGLQSAAAVGDLVLADNVSAPDYLSKARALLGEHLPLHTGALVTRSAMAETVAAKTALGRETGAVAVDMETAWIAGICAETGVPLLSLRAISDAVGQAFPVPGHILFDARRQRPRYFALPLWLLLHPGRIAPFVRFVRGVRIAQGRLTRALQTLVSGI